MSSMNLNFSVFQEPRGLMRILQLVFSISAFATVTEFTGEIVFNCEKEFKYLYDYPFKLNPENYTLDGTTNETQCHRSILLSGDFSSDARFFVATGVLTMLFALGIIFVYAKYDELYKTNSQVPLVDFILTVIFAVLWLSSSAAWGNGLTGLKHATNPQVFTWAGLTKECVACIKSQSGFSSLNISVILGFLNFFLWASDLWFVYKETAWFQGNQGINTSGV